jgi:tRNA pseudouridine38-40 synthase
LDLEAMRAAAAHLVGERDFSTFRASGCQASSPVRTLWDIRVDAAPSWPPFPAAAIESARPDDFSKTRVIDEDEDEDGVGHERRKKRTKTGGVDGGTTGARRRGPLTRGGVVITVSGPSFLYHQVRLMVSTLRAVGAGTIDPDDVPALLERKTPAAVPAMAPAHGLYLGRVHYDGTREWSPRTEGGAPAEGGDE